MPSRAHYKRSQPSHSKLSFSRAAFSVIELTMVIGVLSLLLAIVLPTIKTIHAAALRNRAETEASALAQAAIHYKSVYGFWPGQLEENSDSTFKLRSEANAYKDQYGFLPPIFSGPKVLTDNFDPPKPFPLNGNEVYRALRRIGEKNVTTYKPNPFNPKGIHFVDLTHEDDPAHVTFLDPWGNAYALLMGMNERSSFELKNKNTGTVIAHLEGQCAYAISGGPEGFNESNTNYIYSAGSKR